MLLEHKRIISRSSQDIEGRVLKKLFQELSRTQSRILGALSRLEEFLLNPLIQCLSGSVPDTSRNTYEENQGTDEDRSQNDPHLEAGVSLSQSSQDFGPDEAEDTMVEGKLIPKLLILMLRAERLWLYLRFQVFSEFYS